jgi:hypothetical protein
VKIFRATKPVRKAFVNIGSGLLVAASVLCAMAPAPAQASALWTVNFKGEGSSHSNAQIKITGLCPSTSTSTIETSFSWTVTWHSVRLTTPTVMGAITGQLTGEAHETYELKTAPSCGKAEHCDKSIDFQADESSSGEQPAALIYKRGPVGPPHGNLILDLLAGPSQMAGCTSLDTDDTGFYFAGTPNQEGVSATDALAATVQLTPSDLHLGKIIALVHKTAFNFPSDNDCSDPALLTTCDHSQDWSGTVTMTRA